MSAIPGSDRFPHRSEMSQWAMCGHSCELVNSTMPRVALAAGRFRIRFYKRLIHRLIGSFDGSDISALTVSAGLAVAGIAGLAANCLAFVQHRQSGYGRTVDGPHALSRHIADAAKEPQTWISSAAWTSIPACHAAQPNATSASSPHTVQNTQSHPSQERSLYAHYSLRRLPCRPCANWRRQADSNASSKDGPPYLPSLDVPPSAPLHLNK